jgi:phage baseplate assembly protein W
MSDSIPPFVGRGFSFPLAVDGSGAFRMESGAADIEKAMRVILMTAPGERPMRPDFGCRIWELLFEPINANTIGRMRIAVMEAMSRWEPRAEILDVAIDESDQAMGAVNIAISYRIQSTNDERNLVLPFYTIPGEGEDESEGDAA